jgi:hypothetical protein
MDDDDNRKALDKDKEENNSIAHFVWSHIIIENDNVN